MSDYLPKVYREFRDAYPDVADALDQLGAAAGAAGPLDSKTQRLAKLGIAVGALAEGSVRSNARRALEAGADPEEIRQVAVLAITTAGFPTGIAALTWVNEVLAAD